MNDHLWQYQAHVEPIFSGAETPSLDKWEYRDPEPKPRDVTVPAALVASFFLVELVAAPLPNEADFQYPPQLADDVEQPNVGESLFSLGRVEEPQAAEQSIAALYPALDPTLLPEPPNVGESVFLVEEFVAAPVPDMDSWYRPLDEPVLPLEEPNEGPSDILVEEFVPPPAPPLDSWYRPLEEPVPPVDPVNVGPSVVFVEDFAVALPDVEWIAPIETPTPDVEPLNVGPSVFYVTNFVVVTQTFTANHEALEGGVSNTFTCHHENNAPETMAEHCLDFQQVIKEVYDPVNKTLRITQI